MSKIVENAGITRSSLYRHLPPRPVVTQTAQDIRFVIGASDFSSGARGQWSEGVCTVPAHYICSCKRLLTLTSVDIFQKYVT